MAGIMIQAALLVMAILAVRKLAGEKLHAYVRYGLWLLVVLRLLIPVNLIDSPLSVLRIGDALTGQDVQEAEPAEELGVDAELTEHIADTSKEWRLAGDIGDSSTAAQMTETGADDGTGTNDNSYIDNLSVSADQAVTDGIGLENPSVKASNNAAAAKKGQRSYDKI